MSGSGKNSKIPYYIRSGLRLAAQRVGLGPRLPDLSAELARRPDREYILARVDYYNKLSEGVPLPADAPRLGDFRLKGNKSAYFFDAFEFARYFDPDLHWEYIFGDVAYVPEHPSIVKSRPVEGENANSVLLNLNKNRHFTFLDDRIPFRDKADGAIFRGHIHEKPHRVRFMERYYGHPRVETGVIGPLDDHPAEWARRPITLWDHLKYRYILAIEGNDVASNLKWIMSSNSLAVMPRPSCETWFMEGTLRPGIHYVEIAPDYADLIEKMDHYSSHPAEAEEIVKNAHEYVAQFQDNKLEKLISLLVLEKYFSSTFFSPKRK